MPTFQSADGLPLHRFDGPPPSAPLPGSVLLVHGLGEHLGRYAHVAAFLARQGWQVIGHDQRGHGRSPGPRGAIAQADSLLADLGAVVGQVRAVHPGPLLLVGHSLGGLVAGRYVAEGLAAQPAPWWRPVDGLVMSSPALDPGMNAFQKALLALAAPLAPDVALGNGLKPGWISRDPAVVQAYRADPLVHDRVTPRLARFIVDAGRQVLQAAPGWRLPTLLLYAGADRCVAPAGSAAFAAAAPGGVLLHRRYDGLAHEIFNEPEQDEVLADLGDWLRARWPASA